MLGEDFPDAALKDDKYVGDTFRACMVYRNTGLHKLPAVSHSVTSKSGVI